MAVSSPFPGTLTGTTVPARRVALCGSSFQHGWEEAIAGFIQALSTRGIAVTIQPELAGVLSRAARCIGGAVIADDILPDTSLAVSIGGDGTFLRTARMVGASGIPVIGLNTGHLGFLSSNPADEWTELAEAIALGQLDIEERMILRLSGADLPSGIWPYALNEVAFVKADTSSMINVEVTLDGCFLANYQADGLIVSTPTGSTGYNLSVGGPILQPNLRCMVLSPIAPHMLTLRPLVVDGESKIQTLTTSRAGEYRVSVDNTSFLLPAGSRLQITRARHTLHVARMIGGGFAATLRDKLLWGESR